jgi:menaquinone-specific isochorismate synthase
MNVSRVASLDWEAGAGQAPTAVSQTSGAGVLVSYSLPAPGVTVAGFLRQAQGRERFYWQNGQDQIAFAGFGAAAEMMGWGHGRFQEIERQAQALFANAVVLNDFPPLAQPRLFGGFAFQHDFVPDNTWAVFHPAHFILPHYQLVQFDGASWLTINALIPPEEDPQTSLAELHEALTARYELLRAAEDAPAAPPPAATAVDLTYPMSYAAWAEQIETAVARMQTTELNKIVLARVCEARFDGRVPVDQALAHLNARFADCYRFLFEPRPGHAFWGATPELLVRVNGRALTTMGLAGSIRRGRTPQEDAALAQALLASPKDRYEHALVVDSIRRRLAPLVDGLRVPAAPAIYPLSNIQHLYTPIDGRLRGTPGVLPLVELLHPTPALGGQPRNLAMDFIRDAEPVPRGWYAAPIGWIDHRLDGEFGVAIRSAVSQERRAWLYAGAGIVAGSNPQTEWEETGWKFRAVLDALEIVNGEL